MAKATGVTITDTLPSDLGLIDTGAPDDFVWTADDINAGTTGWITITATLDPSLEPGHSFMHTASLSTDAGDAYPDNNLTMIEIQAANPGVFLPIVVRDP